MNKVAIQVSNRLTYFSRASFSKMLQDRMSNPIKDRVMSTPTWPVPYYQRIHRAYPVRGTSCHMQRKKLSIFRQLMFNSVMPTGMKLNKSLIKALKEDKLSAILKIMSKATVILCLFSLLHG